MGLIKETDLHTHTLQAEDKALRKNLRVGNNIGNIFTIGDLYLVERVFGREDKH